GQGGGRGEEESGGPHEKQGRGQAQEDRHQVLGQEDLPAGEWEAEEEKQAAALHAEGVRAVHPQAGGRGEQEEEPGARSLSGAPQEEEQEQGTEEAREEHGLESRIAPGQPQDWGSDRK